MGDYASLARPRSPEVPRIVIELIRRAESFAAQGLAGEANSAFHAAVVADDTPHARLAYAAHLVSHSQWATAELQLQSALSTAHARGCHDERRDCCLGLALVTGLQGDLAGEHVWLQQAIKWQLAEYGELSAEVLISLALHSIRTRDLAVARIYLNGAESLADEDDVACIRLHLAILDWLEGDERSALDRLTEAHRAFRSNDDLEGCAFALINSGHILKYIDCPNEAIHCYEQAQRIFETLGQSKRTQKLRGFRREVAHAASHCSEAYLQN